MWREEYSSMCDDEEIQPEDKPFRFTENKNAAFKGSKTLIHMVCLS